MFPQEFLKKEFSEENILFWQACEYFSHVPATDKKQVSYSVQLQIQSQFCLGAHCELVDYPL